MPKTKQEILDGIKYLFSKINWGASFLDAEAIGIMNTLTSDIEGLSVKCEDVDEKTIRARIQAVLEANHGKCLDTPDEREEVASALTNALARP